MTQLKRVVVGYGGADDYFVVRLDDKRIAEIEEHGLRRLRRLIDNGYIVDPGDNVRRMSAVALGARALYQEGACLLLGLLALLRGQLDEVSTDEDIETFPLADGEPPRRPGVALIETLLGRGYALAKDAGIVHNDDWDFRRSVELLASLFQITWNDAGKAAISLALALGDVAMMTHDRVIKKGAADGTAQGHQE